MTDKESFWNETIRSREKEKRGKQRLDQNNVHTEQPKEVVVQRKERKSSTIQDKELKPTSKTLSIKERKNEKTK